PNEGRGAARARGREDRRGAAVDPRGPRDRAGAVALAHPDRDGPIDGRPLGGCGDRRGQRRRARHRHVARGRRRPAGAVLYGQAQRVRAVRHAVRVPNERGGGRRAEVLKTWPPSTVSVKLIGVLLAPVSDIPTATL